MPHQNILGNQIAARGETEAALGESEARSRAFVLATSDIVYRMSADWRIMIGLEGRNFVANVKIPNPDWLNENIHPDDRALVLAATREAIRTKSVFELEHRVVRADGGVGWTFSRAIPLLNEQGEIVEWFGVARDITDMKSAQARMEQLMTDSDRERRLYETILSNTPDLAYVFALDHRFAYANKALLAMWGRTAEDSIGKTCWELGYEPWHAAMHDREIEEVVATKKPVRGEVPFHGTAGKRIYDYILVPVIGAKGEVVAVAGTTRDVTDRKTAEDVLRRESARLQSLVNNAPMGVYLVDQDFRLRLLNTVATPVFGNIPNLIGRDFAEVLQILWPAEYAAEVVEIFKQVLKAGEPYVNPELTRPRLDRGVTEHYDFQVHRIPMPDGTQGVVCYFRDISSQVQAREKLIESEHRLRFMAESMPQKIFTTRPNGEADYHNAQWAEFTGLSMEQISHWGWSKIIHPNDLDETMRVWAHSLKTGDPFQIEQRFRRHDGIYFWHLSRARAMHDDEGKILMWIGSSTDITELVKARETVTERRKELERLVEERTASLRKAVEEMEEFSYSVSHDLRAPLRSMHGFAEVLRDEYSEKLDEPGREYLGRIISGAARMDRLTRDVLSYSKLGLAPVELKPVSLDALVQECLLQYSLFSNGGAEVVVDKPLQDVIGHEALLMQTISNLIGNALKFVAKEKTPLIRIRSEQHGDRARLYVEDNGIGVPPAHQNRVWGMFERLPTKQSYEGTGIGLAIVRKAVQRMNGSVGVESDGTNGSRFWIELAKVCDATNNR